MSAAQKVQVTHEDICRRFQAKFPTEYELCLTAASLDQVSGLAQSYEEQLAAAVSRSRELEAELLELSGGSKGPKKPKAAKDDNVTPITGDSPAEPVE